MILQTYVTTKKTYAILPAKQIDYQTIVLEEKETYHVNQSPLDIVKESCMHYWSTYEGRRTAVIQKLGYKQKTPIPISVTHNLCFLPTHSPTHMDNCWINRALVNRWERIEKNKRTSETQTEVVFNNWYRLELGISIHTLQQQMERAFKVMLESGMVQRK